MLPPPKKQHPTRISADEERKVMLEFTCVRVTLHLDKCVYQCPHSRANMHPCLPLSPRSSNTLSSHRSPITPHPHSPHVALCFAHGPRFSSHPCLITQIRSSSNHHAEPLNTPHSRSTLLIPLSSCPRFSSQFQHKRHEYCRGGVMLECPLGLLHHHM